MAHDPKLLDRLEALEQQSWNGTVYRYTGGGRPPDQENTMGARWNPPEVPAIYTSLDRETMLAELENALAAFVPRPRRAAFTAYEIRVSIEDVLDLRVPGLLEELGVTAEDLAGDDHRPCQRVGGAAAWLSRGGLLVPSARRAGGSNLVIFPHAQDPNYEFEVISKDLLGGA
jgi:RES domain-containing protein